MLQARHIAPSLALLALLALLGGTLAARSSLLASPLPPGERAAPPGSALHGSASVALDGVAGRLGLACGDSEVFVWDDSGLVEAAAWLEAASFEAGAIYREIHRDFDTVIFRAFLDRGERLGMWVRLDGATLLAVCVT
jgi:hypothetical protein